MNKSPEEIVAEHYVFNPDKQEILLVTNKLFFQPVNSYEDPKTYLWVNLFVDGVVRAKDSDWATGGTAWKSLYPETIDDMITALQYIKEKYFS